MDTRIGHDSSNEALLLARVREHVQRAFCFQSAARLQHVKFPHHDKQVVGSERILRKTRRDLNPLCLPFLKAASLGLRTYIPRQRGGSVYLYHVLRGTRLPVSMFSPRKR
jgi:hypothetical protein